MSHNNPGQTENLFAVHKVSAVGQERLGVFRQYLKIEDRQVQFLIDTGSSTNILNYRTFTLLQKHRQFQLQKTKVKLVPYGAQENTNNLKVLGKLICLLESKHKLTEAEFFIVDTNSDNIIGGNLALDLNLLSLHVNQILNNTDNQRVPTTCPRFK